MMQFLSLSALLTRTFLRSYYRLQEEQDTTLVIKPVLKIGSE